MDKREFTPFIGVNFGSEQEQNAWRSHSERSGPAELRTLGVNAFKEKVSADDRTSTLATQSQPVGG